MLLLFPGGYALAQIASLDASLRLQTVAGIAIPHQNGIPVPSFEKQRRTTINLAGPWRKQRFAANHDLTLLKRDAAGMAELLAEAAGRQEPGYDDSGWPLHHIPGVENTINAYEKRPEYYQDGVWYRRVFAVPGELRGKFAKLIFYAVNYVADVWLNGRYLGYHEGGYTSFAFDATPALRYDTLNVIAVRVDNPPWGSRTDIIPYSRVDWFNYTGILHDVYLEFADEISVVRADIVPKDLNGRLQTTVTVFNAGTAPQDVEIALQVYAARVDSQNILSESAADLLGAPVAVSGETRHGNSVPAREAAVWRTEIIIANPRLWSPQTPHLYILQVTLARGSRVVDAFHTQFGVRTAKTSGTKFLLNEKPAFFVGVARHEDHPVYGRSMPVAARGAKQVAVGGARRAEQVVDGDAHLAVGGPPRGSRRPSGLPYGAAMDDHAPLTSLTAGQPLLVGGDRVTHVTPELAAAFAPGDALLVLPEHGDVLHLPAAERAAARAAM
ncbi:MAG: beta galactosidase jelly roll domain-containing protein [candidate division KSB1 bacterium]|nr:beta galactosidase jelly roll domain-containing protein [candidate division KSB1 bacterium]